jgi:hypothetical protein
MAIDTLGYIGTLGNLGMQILGGINAQNLNQWVQGGLSTQYINNLANYGAALPPWWSIVGGEYGTGPRGSEYANRMNELRQAAMSNMDQYNAALTPQAITQLFQNSGMYITPEMQAANLALGNVANTFTNPRDVALQGFMGGGWTPQYQSTFDRMNEMRTGQGWQMGTQANVGGDLLGGRGQTAHTIALQNAMGQQLPTGGMNPMLWGGQQTAANVLGNQGYTPGLAGLSQQGAQIMREGGWDPYTAAAGAIGTEGLLRGGGTATTDALQAIGTNLAAREALLPMDKAVAAAGDRASNAAISQFEAAQRRAEARGGGPGPVRGGIQNAGMADYADQAARLVADAQNKAMMDQQSLQLQQRGLGEGMARGAGSLEASRLGTMGNILGTAEGARQGMFGYGASMMPQAESIAAQRMGQAYGAIPGMQNAGTNVLSAYLQGGGMGMQNELGRMGLGGTLLDQYNQQRLQAQGMFNQAMGMQNNYALGLGNLAQGMGALQGDLYGNQFGNWLGAGNLGVNRANMMGGLWNQGANTMGNWMNTANQGFNTGMNVANFPAQGLMDLARTWAGGAATNFNNSAGAMQAPWAYGG